MITFTLGSTLIGVALGAAQIYEEEKAARTVQDDIPEYTLSQLTDPIPTLILGDIEEYRIADFAQTRTPLQQKKLEQGMDKAGCNFVSTDTTVAGEKRCFKLHFEIMKQYK